MDFAKVSSYMKAAPNRIARKNYYDQIKKYYLRSKYWLYTMAYVYNG